MTEPQEAGQESPAVNEPRQELVYPYGSPEDTAGPNTAETRAERDAAGNWTDPDTGKAVDFPLNEPPEGTYWSEQDIRDHRRRWLAAPMPAPQEPPPLTEEQRAEQVAATEPPEPDNLDDEGRPHFLRNVNGDEVCGQDGQPWPCKTWSEHIDSNGTHDLTDEQAAVAAGLGVEPGAFAEFLKTQGR